MMTSTLKEAMNIDCSTAKVFDLMADVRLITRWNAGASRCEMLSQEPIGKGSRFVTVNRGQEMTSTITRFDRPERLEFAVTSKAMDVHGTFRFTKTNARTRLDITFEPQPKGIMKVLFPLLKPMIRRDLVKQHLKFKDYCETQGMAAGKLATA
jgi:uncharacterized protein YndB with AHSA1/START domain